MRDRPKQKSNLGNVTLRLLAGEDPSDSIAEVGEFFERQGGGFVIGDRLLPRVRRAGR